MKPVFNDCPCASGLGPPMSLWIFLSMA
jgi:hypothetical protein